MPTENDQLRTALRWTWAALLVTFVAGSIAYWFGRGTPLGAIVSIAMPFLLAIAVRKSWPLLRDRRSPRA